jgi:amino acid adenylation domain-containing protein
MSNSESALELFQKQVFAAPQHVAVETADQKLTYRELDERSNQVARHLLQSGVKSNAIVALASGRDPAMLVGILGVLKAGAAYLPLDSLYPLSKLAFMVGDAQPVHVLNTIRPALALPLNCPATCLLTEWNSISAESTEALPDHSRDEDLAYVIYTSGSSGRSKGVLLERRGLADMAKAHIRLFSIDQSSRVLQFSSLCFDASVSEIFMTLCGGGTLCMAEAHQLIPGQELLSLLEQREITNVLLPPSALAILPQRPLPKLRTLISGGERCHRDLVRRWGKGRAFFNAYGPTEGTVTATIHRCVESDEGDPPIGIARDNVNLYVLDDARAAVADLEIGELYIGGTGIARGYLNQPELTTQHFSTDPFAKTGGRMYRTGDLVRRRTDGALEFVGRTDHQVKVRGFRVELGEIESCLVQHPQVRQVAAKLCEFGQPDDSHADQRIVAYFTCEPDGECITEELRSWLSRQLPTHAIPAYFYRLDALPQLENGKIDYAMLPAVELASNADSDHFVSELKLLTVNQRKLLETWCSVIGLTAEQLSIDDHFIELGGDSLLSAKIALELESQGMSVAPQDILNHPTIRELAAFIESR